MGPAARRLLAGLEARLLVRALATSTQLALAGLLGYVLLAAVLLALAAPGWALGAQLVAGALPIAGALAFCGALLPLARRPSRRYMAVLAEKAFPRLAGSLVLLTEEHPRLDPGVLQLSAERAENSLKGCFATQVLRLERRSRLGPAGLACALLLGAILLVAGRGQYLDALGEVTGAWGSGPTRITEVSPGNIVLEEGQLLAARCRVTGRQPQWVRIAFRGGKVSPLAQASDGSWRARVAPSGGSYRIEVGARHGVLPSESFSVRLRPRPGLKLAGVIYRYPRYTGLKPRRVSSANIDCLRGTHVAVLLRSTGRVDGARLSLGRSTAPIEFEPAGTGLWRASFPVQRVGAYSISMKLGDGQLREALRGSVTARKDLAPTAVASARELNDGRIAVDYRVTDDYRLDRARMVFRAGGRAMAFAVPDVSGNRESQGAVLVPREVLRAAGSKGFRYQLVVRDTRAPEANVGSSPELEYRPPQRLAFAGPMLEKKKPPRGGSTPPLRPTSGDAPGTGKTTRPLESLHKPDLDEKKPPEDQPSDPDKRSGPDSEFIAPRGEETQPPAEKPGNKGTDPGKNNPDAGGNGQPGKHPEDPGNGESGKTPAPGEETTTTPGNQPTSRPGSRPGSDDGTNPGGEKPPKGNETGSKTPPPERVIPEEVRMGLKPGERLDPRHGKPDALHTDWGKLTPGDPGSSLTPGEVKAPGGRVDALRPGASTPTATDPAPGAPASVAPQYRRYVAEYLRAMAADDN